MADAAEDGLTGTAPRPRPGARRAALLLAGIAVQAACAAFFLFDVLADLLWDSGADGRPHLAVELLAVLGLLFGSTILMGELSRLRARTRVVEDQLRVASGAFAALLAERFEDWGLTPAERDVALMAIKGLSIAEIAGVRGRAEGTVKAQLNAVYAKAGVTGRPQLLSLFIEELLAEPLAPV